jgi:plasmid stabilization system protein ParE
MLGPAKSELREAAKYYNSQLSGLGVELASEVKRAIADIAAEPTAWPRVRGDVRRHLIARFPYAVLYAELKDKIVVIAIMHLKRNPTYWRRRFL